MTFSNKIKAVDTKWKIESFKQGKLNIANFMIEFKVLAINVIATTCQNSICSLLTSAKLLSDYLVVGIYKRTR